MQYDILHCDEIVAKWSHNSFTLINERLAPMYLVNTGNVEGWLETRAIDRHRANSRLLKKALRLSEKDDVSSVMKVNAVTVTDNYWIRPKGSDLTYADVRFDNDYFSKLVLQGGYDSFNKASLLTEQKKIRTPELTNTGSFEKCWKLVKGEWWMYKLASQREAFSEIFIFMLGKRLGFSMAEYQLGKEYIKPKHKYVKTKDFTNHAAVDFEPAFSFMGEDEDYCNVVKQLRRIAPAVIPDYVRMIFLDTIVANPDRHTFNFGLLRDVKTGEILSLAPNFDNNMALIARGYPQNISRKNDVLVRYFNELLAFDPSLSQYIPKLMIEDIEISIKKAGMRVKSDIIIRFIMNGYKQIKK